MSEVLHATTLALWRGGWRAVLLRGPSGVGKSGLALRALAQGWTLVADDRTIVWRSGGRLFGRAPATLAGFVECRGAGVLPIRRRDVAEIVLVADLRSSSDATERLPEQDTARLCDVGLRRIEVWPHDSAAPARLEAALACAATPLGVAD